MRAAFSKAEIESEIASCFGTAFKRREKSSRRKRYVRIDDVVDLGVIEVLADRTTVGPSAGRTLELALKLTTRFHQPAVAQRHKQNRIELNIKLVLPSGDVGEVASIAAEDGNGAF